MLYGRAPQAEESAEDLEEKYFRYRRGHVEITRLQCPEEACSLLVQLSDNTCTTDDATRLGVLEGSEDGGERWVDSESADIGVTLLARGASDMLNVTVYGSLAGGHIVCYL